MGDRTAERLARNDATFREANWVVEKIGDPRSLRSRSIRAKPDFSRAARQSVT